MFQLILFTPLIMLITSVVLFISLALSKKSKLNREKSSPFECGFDSNSTQRIPFSLRFFLITIIFLIFDVEIVMVLPAIQSVSTTLSFHWTLIFFLFLLILMGGLFHEWKEGGLEWAS
uniref:NADH-ubiquinone oxidoreductase chain 3 n=1 Tax=Daphnia galeata TaxID=27404 RepID=A0A1S7J0F5_9CRUS|nr:NADH dehydrogenase subunit 3 [Daphnia galeata]WBR65258.1 NADH dehydrogenase subunit 3 [Daphnia galeata]BAX01976.1 NADH dehydrogenase subunit 3 [Daphnia galeata]BAX01989.1 NADH dehydrogenase subunit 3 [Daphnia galeata]BAX02015.1 NADH dehydrogenase subunit 3 [Daphnia galeata]BAX02028.1 NADH dehydrogenase subunit 3 [Daphnia galeata]